MKKRTANKVRYQALDMVREPLMQPSIAATSGKGGMCNKVVRSGRRQVAEWQVAGLQVADWDLQYRLSFSNFGVF
jgi:hypothetical protein